jgi:hypothetical protein
MMGLADADVEVLAAVHSYLASDAGQAAIRSRLQRRRLPASLDVDIEDRVSSEAHRFLAAGNHIESVAGWCNTRISARVIDITRGRDRSYVDAKRFDEESFVQVESDAGQLHIGSDVVDDIRGAVVRGTGEAWVAAAALAVIARLAHQAVLDARCPQPKSGATPTDAACWAGLWYAGRRWDLDIAPGVPANTVTQRRSRDTRKVKAAVVAAAGERGT